MGSYHVQAQRLDELDVLETEARTQRQRDAIAETRRCIEAGTIPSNAAIVTVQQMIAGRGQQNRYGQ